MNLDELPVVFHVHDLNVLLFFSGRYQEIQTDPAVWASFSNLRATWNEKQRYADPATVSAVVCTNLDRWLNDPTSDVVPWLKARL